MRRGKRRVKRRPRRRAASAYRLSVPRTIQNATHRNKSQMLKFSKNMVYKIRPGGTVGGMENCFLQFRANSIYNIFANNGASNAGGTWSSQDATAYGPLVPLVNADGYSDWSNRYFHSTVVGSKITVTFEPTGIDSALATATNAVPCTLYIIKSGSDASIGTGTEMATINALPYTKKAHITPQSSTFGTAGSATYRSTNQQGCRLSMGYSAKSFEGVTSVLDNDQLKGQMGAAPAIPADVSFFTVGLRNMFPSGAAVDAMISGVLNVKIEYTAILTEPTITNKVQEGIISQVIGGTTFFNHLR